MAVFGKLNTIKEEGLYPKEFSLVVEYLEHLHKEYIEQKKFHLGSGEYKKVELSQYSFAIEQVYETKESNKCIVEAHKKYIDVHYVLDGCEKIKVMNVDDLEIDQAYNEKNDYALYKDSKLSSSVLLCKGDIAIFYPSDAHMTSVMNIEKEIVIKSVVKIPLDNWI